MLTDLKRARVLSEEDEILFMELCNIPHAYVIYDQNYEPSRKQILDYLCANAAHDGLMKCRVRRSEPETTKRRHIAVPPSCEHTPLSDFRLASLCPSQVDGAAPAACPTRAAEAQDAPVLRPGEAAPYAAAVAASFPRGNAAETAARSAAVVA